MRRPDLSQEAIAAAFQAIQRLALDTDAEEAANVTSVPSDDPDGAMAMKMDPRIAPPAQAGNHYYHHHYHHHYFPGGDGTQPPPAEFRPAGVAPSGREAARPRAPLAGAALSRAETAVRKISQSWAQACNTKHLDDLVELYAADALVLRPNFPPVRGTAAIREFFFSALDAGLGEAEMEPIRVELFGDVAYESGRCKTLVPTNLGKRREERGKYLMVFVREPGGDWKTVADCWCADLSLGGEPASPAPQNPAARPNRK